MRLTKLSNDRTRLALIEILEKGTSASSSSSSRKDEDHVDPENPPSRNKLHADVVELVAQAHHEA